MASTFTTPLMNLVLPVVGPQGQVGPLYADNLNDALERVDAHDHTPGNGVSLTQNSFTITGPLDMNDFAINELNVSRYSNLSSTLATPSDVSCVYVVAGDLYFNDGSGTIIQLTSGGGINLTSLGTIGGDYSTSSASATYTAATKLFLWKQDATKTADMAFGSLFIYENITGANPVKIQSPASLAGTYTLTLPSSLPVSTRVLSVSSTGALAAGVASAIVTADIADNAVTTAKVVDGAITRPKLAALGQQLSSSSGNFDTTSTTAVDVTNLTVTITTTGRPVYLGLISDGGSDAGFIGAFTNAASAIEFSLQFLRGASVIAPYQYGVQDGNVSAVQPSIKLAPPSYIDIPAAGTYTYKVQIFNNTPFSPTVVVQAKYLKLIAYEL